jgi:hypothetical protein
LFFTLFMMQMLDTRFVRSAALPQYAEEDAAGVRVARTPALHERFMIVNGSLRGTVEEGGSRIRPPDCCW